MSEAEIKCELMIIGGGIAGMSASVFAAEKGINVWQAGSTTELSLVSGLIDLLGVFPVTDDSFQMNPFDAIDELVKEIPAHPFAKIDKNDIATAVDRIADVLNKNGLPCFYEKGGNQLVVTGAGTVKPSYIIPESMKNGVTAYRKKEPCLIVDIERMKGFSARQVTETLKDDWPSLSYTTIPFPDKKGEVFPEAAAMALETPTLLEAFAKHIIPQIKTNKAVGFPAVLGIDKSQQVVEKLEKLLGVPVFEIPILPPSLPGIRLRNSFEKYLKEQNVTLTGQKKILGAVKNEAGNYLFSLGDSTGEKVITVEAEAAVLATGRFLGGGLFSDYFGIKESLFDIPVVQPENRRGWHSKDFFNPEGHPVNASGIETDLFFRPLGKNGKPFSENLFAAGSIIANNDWMRLKSGAGSSIATAYAAIESYCKLNK